MKATHLTIADTGVKMWGHHRADSMGSRDKDIAIHRFDGPAIIWAHERVRRDQWWQNDTLIAINGMKF